MGGHGHGVSGEETFSNYVQYAVVGAVPGGARRSHNARRRIEAKMIVMKVVNAGI